MDDVLLALESREKELQNLEFPLQKILQYDLYPSTLQENIPLQKNPSLLPIVTFASPTITPFKITTHFDMECKKTKDKDLLELSLTCQQLKKERMTLISQVETRTSSTYVQHRLQGVQDTEEEEWEMMYMEKNEMKKKILFQIQQSQQESRHVQQCITKHLEQKNKEENTSNDNDNEDDLMEEIDILQDQKFQVDKKKEMRNSMISLQEKSMELKAKLQHQMMQVQDVSLIDESLITAKTKMEENTRKRMNMEMEEKKIHCNIQTLRKQMQSMCTLKSQEEDKEGNTCLPLILSILFEHKEGLNKSELLLLLQECKYSIDRSTFNRSLYSLVANGLLHLDRSAVDGKVISLLV